jgi:hypothetical protein
VQQPDVETLVAYANGALTPAEARRIERFLEGNSEARRLIEDYRRTLTVARTPSKAPRRKVPPRHLTGDAIKPPGSAGVERIAPPPRMARWFTGGIALAALLIILAGLGIGAFLPGREEESPLALGRLSAIDALSPALTKLASGSAGMAGDRAVTVLATFRDAKRRPCRHFEMSETSPTAARIVAVACLDGGGWRIEGAAWLDAGGVALANAEGADPLSGPLRRLGAGAALAPEEEDALIAGNWQGEAGGEGLAATSAIGPAQR